MNALVLLNGHAGGGLARDRWRLLAAELAPLFGGTPTVLDHTHDWPGAVAEAIRAGPALILAAGGDGTVHRVANLILSVPRQTGLQVVLGAVGLGSSNDFHKPPCGRQCIRGTPVRCRPNLARPQNVLRVSFQDDARCAW